MKILIVSQLYYPEKFTISDVATELVVLGHDVTVITGKPNYSFGRILPEYKNIKYEVIKGVKVHRVNLLPRTTRSISIIFNYLSFYFNAKRFVRRIKENFDIVFSFQPSPITAIAPAILYAKKHQLRHVTHCLDLWPESTVVTGFVKKDSLMYRMFYKWSRKLYLGCDKILISSLSFADYFREVLHINNIPIVYAPQPSLSSISNAEPIVYSKKNNFVYAGNVGRVQLVDELAKAGKLISQRNDLCIHIIGTGTELENVKKYVTDNDLGSVVICHGQLPLEKTESYYENADALIVSLKDDGYVGKTLPNKLVHYLRFGKPIIGALSGDGRKVLEETKGAVLAEQNAESIAKAMETIINLPADKKEEMGQLNKMYYEEHFEIHHVAQLIERELLDSKNS